MLPYQLKAACLRIQSRASPNTDIDLFKMAKYLLCNVALILLFGRFALSVSVWSDWGDWSNCNCNGERVRTRECILVHQNSPTTPAFTCHGFNLETILCIKNETSCLQGVWNTWSDWTSCSESCGTNSRIRVRNCTNVEYTKLTNDCQGSSIESMPCPEIFCTSQVTNTETPAVWSDWTEWSSCNCNGEQERTRECYHFHQARPPTPATSCHGLYIQTILCIKNETSCRQDSWTNWSSWTYCTVTCGGGVTYRSRNCTTYDQNQANDCHGSSVEIHSCNNNVCDISVMTTKPPDYWTNWSSWSYCTATCGGGVKYRIRNCSTYDQSQANDCHGNAVQTESCNNIVCDDAVLSFITLSSIVSMHTTTPEIVTIAPGSDSNEPSTTTPASHAMSTSHPGSQHAVLDFSTLSSIVSNTTTPATGTIAPGSDSSEHSTTTPASHTTSASHPGSQHIDSWSSWNEWTACTATCGGGDQFRDRHCQRSSGSTANDCTGLSTESRRCATQECSGILSEWLSWTTCPSTCGDGIQFRKRFCNYPGTTNIYRNCHGETVELKVCHVMDCPVDGMWGHWGEWGECLAGRQMRSRKCDGPSPQHGGKECYTDDNARDVDIRTCDAITTPAPRVLEPPTIYGNASTMSGGNVSLLCLTTIAGVSVKWYYKENETLPLHSVQPPGSTHLIITGANVQNMGNYTCLITDKELSSKAHKEVTMEESAAKIISLTAKPTHITDGATVQLQCNALGYPEPIIRWGYKDTFGNPYVPPPVKYTDEGKSILIASYQSILYGGTWTCNAVNKLGADHRDITI